MNLSLIFVFLHSYNTKVFNNEKIFKEGGKIMGDVVINDYYEAIDPSFGVATGMLMFLYLICLAVWVFTAICQWKMFAKAGEPGWAIFVPFYGNYVQFKIAYGDGWKFLLLLIPIVNIVVAIQFNFKIAKAFGKGTAFGFGRLFFPAIFDAIIAFDNDTEYIGPQ